MMLGSLDRAAAATRGTRAESATTAIADPTAVSAGAESHCGAVGFATQSSDLASYITVRNASCVTARKVVRRSRPQRYRPTYDRNHPARPRYDAFGFSCSGREVFPYGIGYVAFRCTRGNAVIRFSRT